MDVVETEHGRVGELWLPFGVVDGMADQPQVTHADEAAPQLVERRLVGLHVAHLEHQAAVAGQRVEPGRRGNRQTERLLGKHVLPGRQRGFSHHLVPARS